MNESVQQQHADFPSEETLAAYIDGRLDGEAREKVVAHLAECADCYGWWETASAAVADEPNVVPLRRPRKWLWPAAAALALAAGLVVVFRQPIREVIDPTWRIDKLAEATKPLKYFPIQTRLSGPFPDKEPEPVLRSGKPVTTVDGANWTLLTVAGEIQKAAKQRPTRNNLRALGLANLLAGYPREAVPPLERLICMTTGEEKVSIAIEKLHDASLLSDLASAYVATGRLNDALRAIDRAAKLDPQSRVVGFNHAYILEQNGRSDDADKAWRQYLQLDSTSTWATEARQHLANHAS